METIKFCVKGIISPKDKALQILQKELKNYKNVLIPKIQNAVRKVVKDRVFQVYAQQKWMLDKKITGYIKNLPFHPMTFHNQSVRLEKTEEGQFYIHFKTRQEEKEAVCHLQIPMKYRSQVEKACGEDNPVLGQVELIEDNKYGWINVHITLRLPKPEPYEPKGWIGVDVGFCKLATSILAVPYVEARSIGHISSPLKGVTESPSSEALSSIAFNQQHKADGNTPNQGYKNRLNTIIIKFSNPTIHGKDYKTRIIQLKYLLKDYARKGKGWKKWNFRLKQTVKYAVGTVAKEIIAKAEKHKAGVAMENLTFQSQTKRWLIPRYKLMVAIKTCCERKGIPFKTVPPRNTSITCPKCRYVDAENRDGERFACRRCGYQADADISAAMNIARLAIYEEVEHLNSRKSAIAIGFTPMVKEARLHAETSGDVATPLSTNEPMTFIRTGANPV